jgi:8-oxo-dGTP pyrophosphatase MutT (NUDIX family)
MDGIERLLQSACATDIPGFLPFTVSGRIVGWVRPEFALALRQFPEVFDSDPAGAVSLNPDLGNFAVRSRALAEVARELAAKGIITGWRDELYAVRGERDEREAPLLAIERAAARAFGITSSAVHVNGVATSRTATAPAMWIARRSLAKAVDPGLLDNMIGGGLAAGLSVGETLIKEGWEEAGLSPKHLAAARAGRRLRIRREVPEGLQSEVIFVHDLELPPTVVPRNQDGEVSEFRLLPVDEVIDLLREGGLVTPDASLVILDWLDRVGILPLPDSPHVRAIFGSRMDRRRRLRS